MLKLPEDPDSDKPNEVADIALRRAQRFLRRIKHEPFIAIVVDEGRENVSVFHTTGIDHVKIQAIRDILDELEQTL